MAYLTFAKEGDIMAIENYVVDRYKAEGFFKHVEWRRKYGVMVQVFHPNENGDAFVTFQAGTFDLDYDQKFDTHREFVLTRYDAMRMMMRLFPSSKIVNIFRRIDGQQLVKEKLPDDTSSKHLRKKAG
jgi:hypothetical protein